LRRCGGHRGCAAKIGRSGEEDRDILATLKASISRLATARLVETVNDAR
jgi:hypothetical protein